MANANLIENLNFKVEMDILKFKVEKVSLLHSCPPLKWRYPPSPLFHAGGTGLPSSVKGSEIRPSDRCNRGWRKEKKNQHVKNCESLPCTSLEENTCSWHAVGSWRLLSGPRRVWDKLLCLIMMLFPRGPFWVWTLPQLSGITLEDACVDFSYNGLFLVCLICAVLTSPSPGCLVSA